MKKTLLTLSLSCLIALAQQVYAQDYVFRVLANKGGNKVVKTGTSQAVSLKTGSKLRRGDQIVAVSDAYIGLVHRSGKTLELRTPGTHKVEELEGKVSTGSASVAYRYMGFVMEKMDDESRDIDPDYRKNLDATGASTRATAGATAIQVRLKEIKNPNRVFDDNATIRWEPLENTSAYVVTVKNVFDQVVYAAETRNTKIDLDFNHERLSKERFIILNVRSKDNAELRSRDYGIQRISKREAEQLSMQLTRLRGELSEESALNNVIIASFFEENNLYLDALTQYEKAVNKSPEVEDYKVIYEEFMLANGIGN